MRRTSPRRRSDGPVGSKYRGDPGSPKVDPRKRPGLLAADDEPGAVCPDCGARVRLNDSGTLRAHSAGGYGPSIRNGHPACPSSGSHGAREDVRRARETGR